MKNHPCSVCAGADCTVCPHNPEYSTPCKIYKPKSAVRAMLVGKVLNGAGEETFCFEDGAFLRRNKAGNLIEIIKFAGLWEELT